MFLNSTQTTNFEGAKVSIIFKGGKSDTFDFYELRTLFDLFEGMYETCDDVSSGVLCEIHFTEFTKEEFDKVMKFTHDWCKNNKCAMPLGIENLLDFLDPRFDPHSEELLSEQAVEKRDLNLLLWAHKNGHLNGLTCSHIA